MQKKIIVFSIFASLILVVIKASAGYFGNSFALIADAAESSVDVASSSLVLLALYFSNLPPDENHPYGHGKIEPLVVFVVSALLALSAVWIAYKSITFILTPHPLPKPWTLIVLAVIILYKETCFRFMLKQAKTLNSNTLKADAWHHRADAITSIAAFIGISISLLSQSYPQADDWAALAACGYILYNSYKIFRPAFAEVMDEHCYDDLTDKVRKVAVTVQGIKDTEKCFVRKSGERFFVDLHARVDPEISIMEGHAISHRLQDELLRRLPELIQVLIHIEPHPEGNLI